MVMGDDAAKIIFFACSVTVFFGFNEMQEHNVLKDIHRAGTLKGAIPRVSGRLRNVILLYVSLASPAPPLVPHPYIIAV